MGAVTVWVQRRPNSAACFYQTYLIRPDRGLLTQAQRGHLPRKALPHHVGQQLLTGHFGCFRVRFILSRHSPAAGPRLGSSCGRGRKLQYVRVCTLSGAPGVHTPDQLPTSEQGKVDAELGWSCCLQGPRTVRPQVPNLAFGSPCPWTEGALPLPLLGDHWPGTYSRALDTCRAGSEGACPSTGQVSTLPPAAHWLLGAEFGCLPTRHFCSPLRGEFHLKFLPSLSWPSGTSPVPWWLRRPQAPLLPVRDMLALSQVQSWNFRALSVWSTCRML